MKVFFKYEILITLILIFMTCNNKKVRIKKKVKTIISTYREGTFSIRTFELKTDSTFRFYRDVHWNEFWVEGVWEKKKDTYKLFKKDKKTGLGSFYFKNNKLLFSLSSQDSSLVDLTNRNLRFNYTQGLD